MATADCRPTVTTHFHFDISDGFAEEDYFLSAIGKRYRLARHTAATRAQARAAWPPLAAVPDDRLTHYSEPVAMPADRVVRVHVKHTLKSFSWAKAEYGVGHAAIHVPPSTGDLEYFQFIDYPETARTLLFHHPDLINVDPTATNTIKGYMLNDPTISDLIETLAGKMRDMGPPTESSGWANLVPYVPPPNPETKINPDNKTFYYTMPTDEVQTAAGAAMTALMKVTKNDLTLQGKKWTLETGASVQPNPPPQSANAVKAGASDSTWQPALQNNDNVSGLTFQIQVLDASKSQLQLTLSNNYIRFLGAYIRFFDASAKPMNVPDWTPDGGGEPVASAMGIQYDDLRYIGHVGPQNNILAIPIPPAGGLTAGITFPDNAVSATIYGSGLGTGSDEWPLTPIVGGLLTGIVNLGIPTFMLAVGTAAQAFGPAYTIVETLMKETPFIVGVLVPVVSLFSTFGTNGEIKMNWGAITGLFKVLFNKGAAKLLLWMEAEITADEIEEQIPFAGWIMVTINISLGLAQLAETIVEVSMSPWNIENTISITLTTNVSVHPDPRHGAFPPGKTAHYVVKMIYQGQTRPTRTDSHDVTGNTGAPLTASFPNNTLGGQVKFEADYYVGDWLAGKATTGWMMNDQTHVTEVELYLVDLPVPLTSQSVYEHSALLTYQSGGYVWQSTGIAPTATIANADTGSGNAISEWTGLTLSQRAGMIGLAWKAAGMGITSCVSGANTQLFAMQNVNIPGAAMNAVKFPNCGLDGQTLLAYDPYPPKFQMKNGNWVLGPDGKPLPDPSDKSLGNYYVDPRKASNPEEQDGGYHLRLVTLDETTPFNMAPNQKSYARFRHQPDSIALHPSGHVVAINSEHKRIQIGVLALDGASDEDLPLARVYGGEAQVQHRPGFLFHPVAVTCSYDGTILVLEDTKSSDLNAVVLARIQAFDLRGRPVNRFFDSDGKPSPFLNISATGANTYLDIAAVGDQKMTYMYVLYYTGAGDAASDYHMSIYQYGQTAPGTNPLATTDNLAAAKLAVDMWHTAYVLNYDMTTDGKGNHAGPSSGSNAGPAGRTVPSVSEWLPPTPKS